MKKKKKLRGVSKAELEIFEWFKTNKIQVEKIYSDDKKFEVDIFLKDFNLGIEFNGLYWHSYEMLTTRMSDEDAKTYHLRKTEYFRNKGIQIIHIWENEWRDNEERLKDYFKSIIYDKPTRRSISLEEDDIYVRINEHKFCGIEKIEFLKSFYSVYKKPLIIEIENRWENWRDYTRNGWKIFKKTSPDYFLFKTGSATEKNLFKRGEVDEEGIKLKIDGAMVGYTRIYDCGKTILIYNGERLKLSEDSFKMFFE